MAPLDLSPADFRALSRKISDFTADYLERLPNLPAFPLNVSGEAVNALFSAEVPIAPMGERAFDPLADVFALSRPNSPRFFGYVFGSGLPIAALGDFAASVLNQNVTAWRSGPAAVTIERTVVGWLAEAIGCSGFSGSLTGGGSQANLMALCMAREAKAPANENGAQGGVIYCSDEAHMSMPKAAMMLGLGQKNVRRIPVNDRFQMDISHLRDAIMRDLREGNRPIAVVASAGTVATGSIDPLPEIADICSEHNLWMHVDGAYGALAAMTVPEKFVGLNRADSLSLDPHKWLYQPAGCGCLLYRDPAAAQRAFSHTEDYARSLSTDPIESFAFFESSMELSRPFRALKIWLSLRYFGLQAFQQRIAEDLRLARILADSVSAEPQLELLAPVELSAVCFRYVRKNADLDHLNLEILQRIIQRGKVCISNATIRGQFALRACVVNHRSTEEDVKAVVSEVLHAANEVSG
ncbi:Pyridoxal-dependent decarboxylase [Candidatus Koribacter versatilis Ellin345]|uniref:Pyridoxal-dependent decarboxylase n=1 Tax=Koribacter versatilis (strain Ellin345) TaxID=204669 RepID=Q1IT63_KORVE|nr:aminotransferase class V-fold PLP-dependent enzyme [Candidatus Koribacter versatilis]ABF39937.1 Pyridoxal-dependent decarboxylase [Candidatus Koribacter versatilis Ellin345]